MVANLFKLQKLFKHPKYTETWSRAESNEYERLFQGCGTTKDGTKQVEGTNTCQYIRKDQILKDKITMYNRSVADVRPKKKDEAN